MDNAMTIGELATKTLGEHMDMIEQAGGEARNLHRWALDQIERPVLEMVMTRTHGNQSKAADLLGMNRATLRTRLKRFNML